MFFVPLGVTVNADYEMFIGNSGISFVTQLPAIKRSWGLEFYQPDLKRANLIVAGYLGQMGLISKDTFEFQRFALELTQPAAATALGITLAEVQGYESGVEIPVYVWNRLCILTCDKVIREFDLSLSLCPQDFRGRKIRITVDPVQRPSNNISGCSTPCPKVACCLWLTQLFWNPARKYTDKTISVLNQEFGR